jgi:nuclease-like protein
MEGKMSMFDRLFRDFDSFGERDGAERGGMLGEDYAESIIDDGQNGCYVRNPIIPHPKRPGIFFETDFLVYTRGILFCVEIKNFQGKVYYPARYRTIFVEKGWFIFKQHIPQLVIDGYDYSKMIQEKGEQRGGGITRRELPNPYLKTKKYIEDLRRYLCSRIDARLGILPIYPVVGFLEKADISSIYNFDAGIMYTSQLRQFFEKYGHPAYSRSPAPWIQQALHRLPTWDRIFPLQKDGTYGVIAEKDLNFQAGDGRWYSIPYAHINCIDIRKTMHSPAYDEALVTYVNGATQSFQIADGAIRMNRFKGEQQVFVLRNIQKVVVGIANKF